MSGLSQQELRAYVDYLRDMGIYDLYRQDAPRVMLPEGFARAAVQQRPSEPVARPAPVAPKPVAPVAPRPVAPAVSPFAAAQVKQEPAAVRLPPELEAPMPKPVSFDALAPLP